MASLNKYLAIGRLSNDPQKGEKGPCKFSLVVEERFTTKSGEEKTKKCFVPCVAWGKVGDTIQTNCHEKDEILVDGKLEFYSYETNDGEKKSGLQVNVWNMQFISSVPF
jgi:single-strand DNA-binding protein